MGTNIRHLVITLVATIRKISAVRHANILRAYSIGIASIGWPTQLLRGMDLCCSTISLTAVITMLIINNAMRHRGSLRCLFPLLVILMGAVGAINGTILAC